MQVEVLFSTLYVFSAESFKLSIALVIMYIHGKTQEHIFDLGLMNFWKKIEKS